MTFDIFRYRPPQGRVAYRIKFGHCTVYEGTVKSKSYIVLNFLNTLEPDDRKFLIAALQYRDQYESD